MAKLKGGRFRWAPLARAIQGNFDHLMGVVRSVASAHNLVVDDLNDIADFSETVDATLGDHDTTLDDHETRIVNAEGDVIIIRGEARRKPPALYYTDNEDFGMWVPPTPSGASGVEVEDDAVPVATATTLDFDTGISAVDDGGGHVTVTGHTLVHDHSGALDGGATLAPDLIEALEAITDEELDVAGRLLISGSVNPSISSNQDDFFTAGMDTSAVADFVVTGTCDLTGIDPLNGTRPSEGMVYFIESDETSTNDVTLKHQSLSSVANNRFELGGGDIVLAPGQVVLLRYTRQGASGKWFLVAYSGAASGTPGADGARGQDGVPGFNGEDGDDGMALPGARGADGAPGAAGSTGATGAAGPALPWPGDDGDEGLGFPGARGADGAAGAAGSNGAAGAPGLPGWPGLDGEDGESFFIPAAASTGGATNLDGLSDVVISGVADNDSLVYTGSNFVNSPDDAFRRMHKNGLKNWKFEDFMGGTVNVTDWVAAQSGTAATAVAVDTADANHPGIVRCSTGTQAAGLAYVRGTNSANTIKAGGGIIKAGYWVKTPANLSDGTDRYKLRAGMTPTNMNGDPNVGAIFSYIDNVNAGKWQAEVWQGGASTVADAGVAVVADTWYLLEFIINAAGTAVDFYINRTFAVTVTRTITTAMNWGGIGITKSVGTNNRNFTLDAVYVEQTFDTPR